ncbi:MAG: CoA pyrophosphatase [Deltaproteobacteria bacterium]|nr:CoA pyrophosphatase [Deltaproteobacteria bacterium]MCL5277694.1 CoA pyrophosphatase [Deltaproteobacteria bacterium]
MDYVAILRDRLKHLQPRELHADRMRRASVLAVFLDGDSGARLLFTKKAQDIGYHSDQVSFPGGSIEKGETALEAALRETREEIGLTDSGLEILGRFHDDCVPISGYIITPYVAVLKGEPAFRLQRSEVVEVFTVPFDFFMDEANYGSGKVVIRESEFLVNGYTYGSYFIWGLTCRFIRSLIEIMKGTH